MQNSERKIFVILDLKGGTKADILRNIALFAKDAGIISNEAIILDKLTLNPILESSMTGMGLALPEAADVNINSVYAFILCRIKQAILFNPTDKWPVKIVLASLVRDKKNFSYLKPMAKLVKLIKDKKFLKMFLNTKDTDEIYAVFTAEGLLR